MLLSETQGISALVPLLQARKLIIIAGSGVSVDSGLPTWDGLLCSFIKFCDENLSPILTDADEFQRVLSDAKKEIFRSPVRVASVLKREILREKDRRKYAFGGLFQRWLAREFASAKPNANHFAIVKSDYPFILTTNYDDLLAQAAIACGFPQIGGRSYNFSESEYIASAIYESEPCIIHLHGRYEDASLEKIVFTSDDYLAIKHDNKAFAVVVQNLLLRFVVLLVGYGASDPHLEDLMEEMIYLFGEGFGSDGKPIAYLVLERSKATEVLVKYKHRFRTDVIALDNYGRTPIFLDTLAKEGPRK